MTGSVLIPKFNIFSEPYLESNNSSCVQPGVINAFSVLIGIRDFVKFPMYFMIYLFSTDQKNSILKSKMTTKNLFN